MILLLFLTNLYSINFYINPDHLDRDHVRYETRPSSGYLKVPAGAVHSYLEVQTRTETVPRHSKNQITNCLGRTECLDILSRKVCTDSRERAIYNADLGQVYCSRFIENVQTQVSRLVVNETKKTTFMSQLEENSQLELKRQRAYNNKIEELIQEGLTEMANTEVVE